jgi:hypothetical protein
VSRYLRGEDETAWLYRPDSNDNPDLTRRFWDEFAASPHWCPPFAHGVTTTSVKNEGQLRAALASTQESRDAVVLRNDIYLADGKVYDFTGIRFITEQGEYSIARWNVLYNSQGGILVIPQGAAVTLIEAEALASIIQRE